MREILTSEEAKRFVGLCRAGKLYEIEDWIKSGKPLQVTAEFKSTPLQIAIDRGFHSLIELLARNETCQEVLNGGLAEAVSLRQMELIQLLLKHGAEIRAVPLIEVLEAWDPAIIRFFLERGADAVSGAPFARAFASRVRTTLRPFVEYRRAHPELAHELQKQADMALRYFCREGNLKWVSLMLWAGADPRVAGPALDSETDCVAISSGYTQHDNLRNMACRRERPLSRCPILSTPSMHS